MSIDSVNVRLHGRSDELNALVDDAKKLNPSEREAIAAIQDVCMKAAAAIDELREQKDAAYLERNQCAALIARMAVALGRRVCVTKTAIDGWSEDWHGCIYIDLPTGQVSWHFHDSQAYLFNGLPTGSETWDGHTTPDKYQRVAEAYGVDHENLYDLMRRQLVRINDWCCYATEEDTAARLMALQQIGVAARAVLAKVEG